VAKEIERYLEDYYNKPATQEYILKHPIEPYDDFGNIELDDE
jgi:hypothetical protein